MTLCEKIISVKNIYNQSEARIQAFKQATQLNCVPGCGDCCNRFEPYITVLEGLIIADYLTNNPKMLEKFQLRPSYEQSEVLCPFYVKDVCYHCGIYDIRPLICRMFSFCCKKSPQGLELQACTQIADYFSKEVVLANQLLQHGLDLPIYVEEYNKLCRVDFMLATDFHPLDRSVEIALESADQIKNGTYQNQSPHSNTVLSFKEFIRSHLVQQGIVNLSNT